MAGKRLAPWDRREGESAKAFSAFCVYRDLGPERSIDKCKHQQQKGGRPVAGRAPGYWFQWSTDFDWVARAEAWDANNDKIRERAFRKRLIELGRDQAEFTFEEFKRLVRRVRNADKVLDRADVAPVVEVEEEIVEGGRVTGRKRTKPLNFAGYAALMKEARESARRAILGPRDADETPAGGGEGEVVRKIVWTVPEQPCE